MLCCPTRLKTHKTLFGCLEQIGKKVVIDFEAAVRNAVRKMQPDTEIQICFFLLGQEVWRNVQKLRFTRKYMDHDEFQLNVKKKRFAWHSFPLTTLFSLLRLSEKRMPQRNFRVYRTILKTPILVPVEGIDASNQNLTLPIGTIGCFQSGAQRWTSYEQCIGGMEWQLQ